MCTSTRSALARSQTNLPPCPRTPNERVPNALPTLPVATLGTVAIVLLAYFAVGNMVPDDEWRQDDRAERRAEEQRLGNDELGTAPGLGNTGFRQPFHSSHAVTAHASYDLRGAPARHPLSLLWRCNRQAAVDCPGGASPYSSSECCPCSRLEASPSPLPSPNRWMSSGDRSQKPSRA